jgi:four helix bundle protein
MATIKKFEDILAWQKAREMNKYIYTITDTGKFNKDYTIKDQILRASFSIMLNIAEGFGRSTDKEFNYFLGIAHGSTAEVQCALYIALDRTDIDLEEFQTIYDNCTEISKMIMGLKKYLKNK